MKNNSNKKIMILPVIILFLISFCFIPLSESATSVYNVPKTSCFTGSVLPNNAGASAGLQTSSGTNSSLLIVTFYFQSASATLFNGKIGAYLIFGANSSVIETSSTVHDFTSTALPRGGADSAGASYTGYSFNFLGTSFLQSGTVYQIKFYVNQTAGSGGYLVYAQMNGVTTGTWTPTTGTYLYCGSVITQEPITPTPTPTPAGTFYCTVTSTENQTYLSVKNMDTNVQLSGYGSNYTIPFISGETLLLYAIAPNTTSLYFAYWTRGLYDFTNNPLAITANSNMTYTVHWSASPTVTTEPTVTPAPDKLTPVMTSISDFLFGTSGVLGAGFGLIVLIGCVVLCVKLGGKSIELVIVGSVIATIVNVAVGIWEVWTIILLVIAIVAVALKNSGLLSRSDD